MTKHNDPSKLTGKTRFRFNKRRKFILQVELRHFDEDLDVALNWRDATWEDWQVLFPTVMEKINAKN